MKYWTLEMVYSVLPKYRLLELDADRPEDIGEDPADPAYAKLVQAGERADRKIDSYLRGHYSVPLAAVPEEIAEASAVLLVVNRFASSEVDEIPNTISMLHRDAIKLLEGLRDGKMTLPGVSSEAVQAGKMSYHSSERMFGDDVLSAF